MQTRTTFVGVDAHIDPCGTCPHLDEMLRQKRSCPTGGQRRPPLQDVVRFRRWFVQFCNCVPRGRCGHRPLRGLCVVAVWLCDFVIASCAGGVEPLPYGVSGDAAFFTIRCGKPPQLPNGRTEASAPTEDNTSSLFTITYSLNSPLPYVTTKRARKKSGSLCRLIFFTFD